MITNFGSFFALAAMTNALNRVSSQRLACSMQGPPIDDDRGEKQRDA
jgi:hypothetical protein